MSPVSRGRKNAKSRRSGQRVVRTVAAVPEPCDCPECTGVEFDAEAFIADLSAVTADLLESGDPLEVELFGATFVAAGLSGDLADSVIPALAELGSVEAVAALLAIDAVDPGSAAGDAARNLLAAGAPAPAWAGALAEPVTVARCRRYSDDVGEASMMVCSFERSGRAHGFLIHVDHTDCDAAADVMLLPEETLDEVGRMIQADGRRAGVTLTEEELDPAEFRWQIERALDARAVHDLESGEDDLDDDDGPGYPLFAALLRARMSVLPAPSRPPAPHGGDGRPAAREMISRFVERIQPGGRALAPASSTKLPAKRKKSDGPAPIYQIKVGLVGAKPPIWRRLELPADTSLADLHHVIQTAFGWDDSHLHVFETPYGDFGVADRDLEHRAEKPVTLEQVAPVAGAKLRYRYDFGDNWEHEIVVEKVLDRQAVTYPRCTGGRRAAPPDDCGGVWGYEQLVEVLTDPGHPDHEEQREWLGLESAGEFDPARFDAAEVTRALTGEG